MKDVKIYIDISEFLLLFAEKNEKENIYKKFLTISKVTLLLDWNRDF